MSEVLVVIDHAGGEVKKPTYELLTLAKRLGEPSAVFFGSPDQGEAVAEKVKKYGAAKVYVIDDAQIKGFLVAPKAEALQQLAEKSGPAAVLLPSTFENKEVAGRLAIKLGSGLITDAVDVSDSGVTTQSVSRSFGTSGTRSAGGTGPEPVRGAGAKPASPSGHRPVRPA